MHPVEHFKTVFEHRKLVREHCFRLGLYRQGLMHDLSKYSPVEFWRGARYYQGIIDVQELNWGADYKNLKDSYVIFICIPHLIF